jgi:hypothetical protein
MAHWFTSAPTTPNSVRGAGRDAGCVERLRGPLAPAYFVARIGKLERGQSGSHLQLLGSVFPRWRAAFRVVERPLRSQPTDATAPSHFDRLIRIYQQYPEPVDWIPFRPVPTNPNTLISPSSEALLERGRITHPVSRLWAQLSNVRYRMLLLDIAHTLHLEGPMEEMNGSPTMRGSLRDCAFLEMRGQPRAGLRGVSRRLVQLPLKTEVSSQEQAAALPFELPFTLTLPDRDLDRWRLHLALIESAHSLIEQIESASSSDAVLDELRAIDLERRRRIEGHLSKL